MNIEKSHLYTQTRYVRIYWLFGAVGLHKIKCTLTIFGTINQRKNQKERTNEWVNVYCIWIEHIEPKSNFTHQNQPQKHNHKCVTHRDTHTHTHIEWIFHKRIIFNLANKTEKTLTGFSYSESGKAAIYRKHHKSLALTQTTAKHWKTLPPQYSIRLCCVAAIIVWPVPPSCSLIL